MTMQYICYNIFATQFFTNRMKALTFIGAPGSGKSTIVERISDELEIPKLLFGNEFRAIDKNHKLFIIHERCVSTGQLLPDELVNSFFLECVKKLEIKEKSLILIDGYPRTINQLNYFSALYYNYGIIEIKCDEKILLNRIKERKGLRRDNSVRIAKRRIEDYFQITYPIIELEKEKRLVVSLSNHNLDYSISTIKKKIKEIMK